MRDEIRRGGLGRTPMEAKHGPSPERRILNMASVSIFKTKNQSEAGTIHWLNECIKRGQREVFSEVVDMNPGLAAELLRRNPDNRNIRDQKAAHFASDMSAGRWVFNGEPVIIASDGQLNDGQHRMQAIMDANLVIPMLVVFGLPRESRFTLDQGSARTASDYLHMDGIIHSTLSAGIARLVKAYEESDGRNITKAKEYTNAEIVERVKADSAIIEAAQYAQSVAKFSRGLIIPSIIGTCFYVLADIDAVAAKTYLDMVCIGENIKRGDPAFAVREAIRNIERTSKSMRIEHIFRGWNKFRAGEKSKLSKYMGNFPALSV